MQVPAVFTSNWQWPGYRTHRRRIVGCVPEGLGDECLQKWRFWLIPTYFFTVRWFSLSFTLVLVVSCVLCITTGIAEDFGGKRN